MNRFALFFAVIAASWPAAAPSQPAIPAQFVRGDSVPDGAIDLTDAVGTLGYLFLGSGELPCLAAADANDDGEIDLTDPICVLGHLFLGAGPLPAPFPDCGAGRAGGLGCASYPPCEWESVVAAYGDLSTIAGLGARENDAPVNEWDPSFEGGPAVDAELSAPHMAQADAAGNVFIADKDAHAIRKVTTDGKIHTVAGTGSAGDGPDDPGPATQVQLSSPNGLHVRADSTLYILDTGNGKVRRVSPAGQMSTLFAVPGGISIGRGLWVRDDERLAYVSSGTEVKRWTPEKGVETVATDFRELGNLAVDPAGRLVVTDRTLHQVYRISGDGKAVAIAGNGDTSGGGDGLPAIETGLSGVRGVWFLPSGSYFLATHKGSQVWYVDVRGIIHLFLNGKKDAHSGDGLRFDEPGRKVSEVRAVTVDFAGNVIVTEHDAGFVRKVTRLPGS